MDDVEEVSSVPLHEVEQYINVIVWRPAHHVTDLPSSAPSHMCSGSLNDFALHPLVHVRNKVDFCVLVFEQRFI